MAWTVGTAAKLAKVSVRTLHHYDEICLLSPTRRSDSGYRLYSADDLERLHQILLFRELGFALPEIRDIMCDPDFDRVSALKAQRSLLAEKASRTEAMLLAIDAALEAVRGGTPMTDKEQKAVFGELFDGFDPAEYEAEVQERWGESDAYQRSAARFTKNIDKARPGLAAYQSAVAQAWAASARKS